MKVLFDTNIIIDAFLKRNEDCDYIVTRNPKDFSESRIPILSVEDFLKEVT